MRPSMYRIARYTGSNLLIISASSRPKSLKELSNKKSMALHGLLPFLSTARQLSAAMGYYFRTSQREYLLLRRLVGHLQIPKRLERKRRDEAGKQDEMVDESKIPLPSLLVCDCTHGLGNRLRVLVS